MSGAREELRQRQVVFSTSGSAAVGKAQRILEGGCLNSWICAYEMGR